MANKQDYYSLLDVERNAAAGDIKKAYRKKAMQYHPDKHQGEKEKKEAEDKFKEINEAYAVLSDEKRRAQYDQYGHSAFEGGSGGGGFEGFNFQDIFSDVFGEDVFSNFGFGGGGARSRSEASSRGSDIRYDVAITFEEALHGKKESMSFSVPVRCDVCDGKGFGKDGKLVNCSTCGGSGRIRRVQGFFHIEATCSKCGGSGSEMMNPCKKCYGDGRFKKQRTMLVKIPPGVSQGSRVRITGEGEAGLRGGSPGDLYVCISLKKHGFFKLDGRNLHCSVTMPMAKAALGGSVEVPSLEGTRLKVKISPGTQNGSVMRLHGKGMNVSGIRGDMYVKFQVEVPVNLTSKQKALLREHFDGEEVKKCNPESENFLSKVSKLFGKE